MPAAEAGPGSSGSPGMHWEHSSNSLERGRASACASHICPCVHVSSANAPLVGGPCCAAAVRSSSAHNDPAATSLKSAFDYRTILNMLMSIVNTAAASDMATPLKTPGAAAKVVVFWPWEGGRSLCEEDCGFLGSGGHGSCVLP